jgi:ABC-type transport system involved in cytochrome c biogenesis permease subunit
MNTPETLSTCAWLLVIVYAYLELTTNDRALGALVVPIVAVLHVFASVEFGQAEISVHLLSRSRWFETHVFSNILAYTAFSISWVSSMMYVFLLGEIQTKHLGFFYKRLPPLQTLDQINGRAASFGLVFLTLGLFASAMWAYRALGRPWVWDEPAFAGAIIAWVIYASHLCARVAAGWRGKRAAFLSIVGFTLVLFTFPVVGIFFPGKHSFAN